MATREDLVEHLWTDLINPLGKPQALENIIANCRRAPDTAFAEVGPIIDRMLAAGIPQADIGLLMRSTAYEAVFGTLYAIGDPGVDGNDVFGLYEVMLTSEAAEY
jgi:hypothetical protein